MDTAHIIPFRRSHNDDIRNGFSLCKNHHWCFDRGLIGVDDDYEVLISPLVETNYTLTDHIGKILLPKEEPVYPSIEAFQWHLDKIFKG